MRESFDALAAGAFHPVGELRGRTRRSFVRLRHGSIQATVREAGISKHVTTHTFRHTYAATRIQTLDHGAPVSPYTVMRELGHRSLKLIEETYGHLQNRRSRSDVVEYREPQTLEIAANAQGTSA